MKMLLLAFATAAAAVLSGCASPIPIAPYPTSAPPATVTLAPEKLSRFSDVIIGSYQVPNQPIYISGHQVGAGFPLLFGFVGGLVSDQLNSASMSAKVGDTSSGVQIDIKATTQAALQQAISDAHTPRLTLEAGGANLDVIPHVVLTVLEGSDKAVMHVCYFSRLQGDSRWWTRVYGAADEAHPLTGEGGWLSSPALFQAGLEQASRRAARGLVAMADGKLHSTGATQDIKAVLAWLPNNPKVQAIEMLDRSNGDVTFAAIGLSTGTIVRGVYVAPASALAQ